MISSAARDIERMRRALFLARLARENGEVPVGAVLVGQQGDILTETANAPITLEDPTAHAEILALRAGARKLGNYRLPGCTLYVTLEPCPMCASALVHARIERLVYAAPDPKTGACGSVMDLPGHWSMNHRVQVDGGILEEESSELLKWFFKERR
jgi:tRNA(adenine34) deaminase